MNVPVNFVPILIFQVSLIVYQEVAGFKRFLSHLVINIFSQKKYHSFFDVSKLTKSGSKMANQSLGPNSQPLLHNNFYRIMQNGLLGAGQRAPISQQSFIVCFWVDILLNHC